ncbi:hypothetical protein D3C78_1382800 [compost metagenome]
MSAFAALVRASVADNGFNFDQCRFSQICLSLSNGLGQCSQIVAVLYAQHLPAIAFKTLLNALGIRQAQLAV